MKTSNRLPNGFWTANGTYTDRLLSLYIICFHLESNPIGGNFKNETLKEAIEYLQKKEPSSWKKKPLEEMVISASQQTAWGLTNQPSVVVGQVSVYVINKSACKRAKGLAKIL